MSRIPIQTRCIPFTFFLLTLKPLFSPLSVVAERLPGGMRRTRLRGGEPVRRSAQRPRHLPHVRGRQHRAAATSRGGPAQAVQGEVLGGRACGDGLLLSSHPEQFPSAEIKSLKSLRLTEGLSKQCKERFSGRRARGEGLIIKAIGVLGKAGVEVQDVRALCRLRLGERRCEQDKEKFSRGALAVRTLGSIRV